MPASAQHKKVPKEPFQVVDALTGKTIPEILVLPRYVSGTGVFIAPEGPTKSSNRNYLDNPFVYHTGKPFKIKQPNVFKGLPLAMLLIGKFTDIEGILVIAPGYRPRWTDDLWWYPNNDGYERKLTLTPLSDSEWAQVLKNELAPLLEDVSRFNANCWMWALDENCNLKVQYNKKERKLVRSFLKIAETDAK